MFWYEEFWIITLIILLIVYISEKSKHLIVDVLHGNNVQFLNENEV